MHSKRTREKRNFESNNSFLQTRLALPNDVSLKYQNQLLHIQKIWYDYEPNVNVTKNLKAIDFKTLKPEKWLNENVR